MEIIYKTQSVTGMTLSRKGMAEGGSVYLFKGGISCLKF